MKNRARIVSGLAALAALLLAPLAEASLPRTSAPATEASAPALVAPDPEPSAFSLFEGTELARAAAGSEGVQSFHPLAAVSLLSEDARLDLATPTEPSYPKTRYRVFEFLGTPILGAERGVTLELQWGSGEFKAGLASGTVGWLSQDPMGDTDSPNLYGYVAQRPHEMTDPLGLQAARDINTFFAPEIAAALALAREREVEALRQHRLHPGMYAIEGSAFRGRGYYFLAQLLPGTADETTSWHPFAGATQAAADLRAYEREHSREALALDIGLSLAGPGKANKVFGLIGAVGALAERQQEARVFRGGPHAETKKPIGDMRDSHHMPARSVSPLDSEAGPAIQMDRPDHALTSSVGTTPEAMEYRATIKALLEQGKWREAMALEIKDVQRVAGAKYNQAIREMLEYAKALGLLKK